MRDSFAVVTGGSSGIGLELARQLIQNDYDVLLASQDEAHLLKAQKKLARKNAEVTIHAANLATEKGVKSLISAIRKHRRPVDVLCINAGVGLGGAFVDTDLKRELEMIDLNVRGAVQLTKPILRNMTERGSGHVLFTSSIAATMPAPFEAVYGATKVFLRSFSESLRDEVKDAGVGVTVLMPGVTDTDIFRRAGMLDTRAGASKKKDDPADVAKAALEALMADRHKIVPNLKNKLMAAIGDASPAPLAARGHRRFSKPGSARR